MVCQTIPVLRYAAPAQLRSTTGVVPLRRQSGAAAAEELRSTRLVLLCSHCVLKQSHGTSTGLARSLSSSRPATCSLHARVAAIVCGKQRTLTSMWPTAQMEWIERAAPRRWEREQQLHRTPGALISAQRGVWARRKPAPPKRGIAKRGTAKRITTERGTAKRGTAKRGTAKQSAPPSA